MKCKSLVTIMMMAVTAGLASESKAAWIDGSYWADSVTAWTGEIQNYAKTALTESTTWWMTGSSDCFDDNYTDYVAGWRHNKNNPDVVGRSITVYFDQALQDGAGEDLKIHLFSGIAGGGSVWASADGVDYVRIGTLEAGDSYFRYDTLDFSGELDGTPYSIDNVHYVRLDRESFGPQSGVFFDSFEGLHTIPEPATLCMLGSGLLMALCSRRNRSL